MGSAVRPEVRFNSIGMLNRFASSGSDRISGSSCTGRSAGGRAPASQAQGWELGRRAAPAPGSASPSKLLGERDGLGASCPLEGVGADKVFESVCYQALGIISCSYPHITAEETEPQRGPVTQLPKTMPTTHAGHSQALTPRLSGFQNLCPADSWG